MSKAIYSYFTILAVGLTWFFLTSASRVTEFPDLEAASLCGVGGLYLCSHALRMLRLILLTLDKRTNAFPLVTAHALTALPSALIPYKIGEVLRLAAFLHACEGKEKALSIWLVERFGDIFVLAIFICALYMLNIKMPPEMHIAFILFILVGGFGLLGFFAVAKVFIYLNRHLVLTSLSLRGLFILRISHALRKLELKVHQSIDGRLSGLLLLSAFIWLFELVALTVFGKILSGGGIDFVEIFAAALFASLYDDGHESFRMYKLVALLVLTFVFLFLAWAAVRYKTNNQ